jgi:protein SCO1/2
MSAPLLRAPWRSPHRWLLVCALALSWACGRAGESGEADSEAARVASRLGLAATPFASPLPRPDFTLTDTSGRPYAFRSETAGRLTLLFFGYTSCPDVCPAHLASLAAGLRALPPEQRDALDVVFVGVDPERDTRERVREWLDHFDTRIVGLTGSEAELAAAQKAAAVPAAFVDQRFEGGYTVAHASIVLVYTADDQAHLRYGLDTRAPQWSHDLGLLAGRGWPPG